MVSNACTITQMSHTHPVFEGQISSKKTLKSHANSLSDAIRLCTYPQKKHIACGTGLRRLCEASAFKLLFKTCSQPFPQKPVLNTFITFQILFSPTYGRIGDFLQEKIQSCDRRKLNKRIDYFSGEVMSDESSPRMEKSHSYWPRTVWCVVNMFYKNGMRPLIIANGTKCYSILCSDSNSLYIRQHVKYMYPVISVIVHSLSAAGHTKKQSCAGTLYLKVP